MIDEVENHVDQEADLEQIRQVIEPIVTVIKQILEKLSMMDEEIDSLARLVNDEIIGGITNLYNKKSRLDGISSLGSKYGEIMNPYKDFYSELTEGRDIFEALFDELEDYKKSSPDMNDEVIESKVKELAEALHQKMEKMKSFGGASEGSISIAVESPEVKKIEEVGDGHSAIIEKIKKMKADADAKGFRF